MTYKYKTKDGSDLTIVGVGVTVNGTIESDRPIENPNLVLISDGAAQSPANVQGVALPSQQSAQPQVVSEQKQNTEEAK